jgi:integrase/recombinase XerD
MADIKLDYVNSFYDARGKLRHTFRRKGHKKVTIKGRPGSPDFMDAYHALLEKTGGAMPVANIGASRTNAGTIDAVVVKYYKDDGFTKELAKASQKMRRPIIDNFRNFLTPSGRRYGENHFKTMGQKQIEDVLKIKSPNAQGNWLKALRHLIKFAVKEGELASDPTLGIKPSKAGKSKGHMTWKPPQVEQYRVRHPVGTMARVALELMLNIAARRTDCYQIGRPHMAFNAEIQGNVLTWRPQKTANSSGKVLSIPVLPFLQEALDAMPKPTETFDVIPKATTALTFLTNDYGKPFASAAAFGNKFADWCDAAELPTVMCPDGRERNYRAHGLRKAALYTLYKLGAKPAQLQAIGGHSTLAELDKYIQEVEQDEQAIGAMALVAEAQKSQMKNRQ